MVPNFRFHRGGLKESMATVVSIECLDDLAALLELQPNQIQFQYYGYDERIKTHCYTVCVPASGNPHDTQYAIIGFIDNLNFTPPKTF